MPKLWESTIEAHRREVRDAILDTTAALVAESGLLAVTMSEIAETTGIGRATLYKYFPDLKTILLAWHEREIARHLQQLTALRDEATDPWQRLAAVLEAYAFIVHASHRDHGRDLVALLHDDRQLARPRHLLLGLIGDLLENALRVGDVRDDIPPDELGAYCLNALDGARVAPSKAAVRRLVTVTLDGLRASG